MKYLFLLLLLTACAKENITELSPEEQEIACKNLAFRDNIISNYYNPPPKVEKREIIDPEADYYERPGNHEELEAISISEHVISLYLTNINPYRKEYEAFFEEQFNIYGRDDDGLLMIDELQLWEMNTRLGFMVLWETDDSSQIRVKSIRIVEHGKTNYYPSPSNH